MTTLNKKTLSHITEVLTYKRLLWLCTSPYTWGAGVWIAGSIGTHPHCSSFAIRGFPHLLSHPAQTTYSSQVSVAGHKSVLRAPDPGGHP